MQLVLSFTEVPQVSPWIDLVRLFGLPGIFCQLCFLVSYPLESDQLVIDVLIYVTDMPPHLLPLTELFGGAKKSVTVL